MYKFREGSQFKVCEDNDSVRDSNGGHYELINRYSLIQLRHSHLYAIEGR